MAERDSHEDELDISHQDELGTEPSATSIWDDFAEIVSQIPIEQFDRLPTDAAANHDAYLYGVQEDRP